MAYIAASVDIGSWSLKVTLARIKMRSIQILDFKQLLLRDENGDNPSYEVVSNAIRECFLTFRFRPEVVVTTLSGTDFFFRILQIPKAGVKKMDRLAATQIEDDLPLEGSQYIVDTKAISVTPDGKFLNCMVVAAARENVINRIKLLEENGLDPSEISCSPSIFPAISTTFSGCETVALLEMGHQTTELIITDSGKPFFFRNIIWGGKDITERIASHLSLSFAKAEELKQSVGSLMPTETLKIGSVEDKLLSLCRESIGVLILELRRSFMSFMSKTGKYPGEIIIFGGSSRIRGIESYIEQATGIKAKIYMDDTGLPPESVRSRKLLEQMLNPDEKKLNFRKEELVYRGKLQVAKRKWLRVAIFVATIIVGWFIYSGAKITTLRSTILKQQKELAQITTQITGEGTGSFDKAELLLKKSASMRNPVPKQDAYDILEQMSLLIPEEVIHDVEELDIRSDRWRIRGMVDSIGDRDIICKSLEEYKDCVTAITKGNTTLSQKDNRQKYNLDIKTTCP
ncbi:MAG: pilus assembly protein PilM [Candidatus Omnitrophica bacterium]|nr:pilus assembly protein PilM [Candidatus Omnitrophota bacterium]